MGKSASKQRDLERKFTQERDKLFKEFSCAKIEIQRNFNKQRHELEITFHQEIQKLYSVHQGQINTIKLQMRDSQLGDLHEKLRGRLSRHLSWPIAESTPKHSDEIVISGGSQQKKISKNCERDDSRAFDEWQILVEHLKFALNNQKALFENALVEEKEKMQRLLEMERLAMEEKLFKHLNSTLLESLKERNLIMNDGDNGGRFSRNMMSEWVLVKEYSKQQKRTAIIDSDSDEENSCDSGVDENGRTKDKRGNYWRMKYMECQKRNGKKLSDMEEKLKRKEQFWKEEVEKVKKDMNDKHLTEMNDVQNIAAKELQKSLKEERTICKSKLKQMNEKIISLSNENDELREEVNELQFSLGCEVNEVHQEMKEKLEHLKEILIREDENDGKV